MATPVFDPNQPFQVARGQAAPAFDPTQPFEVAGPAATAVAPRQPASGGGTGSTLEQIGQEIFRTFVGAGRDLAQRTFDFAVDIPGPFDFLRSDETQARLQQGREDLKAAARLPEVERPQSTINDVLREILTVATPGVAGGVNLARSAPQVVPAVRGLIAGAGADLAAGDIENGNLSNLVQEKTGAPLITAIDPNDSDMLNRLRNVAEGGVLGGALDTLLSGVARALTSARGAPVRVEDLSPEDMADPTAQQVLREAGLTDRQISQLSEPVQARVSESVLRQEPSAADEIAQLAEAADAFAIAGRKAEAPGRQVAQEPPSERTLLPGAATRDGQQSAFDIANLRRQRAEAAVTEEAFDRPGDRADLRAGGRPTGRAPQEEFAFLDARMRDGQMVAGERVEIIDQLEDGSVEVRFPDRPEIEPVVVSSDRITNFSRPEDPRMAQEFMAASAEPRRGVGQEMPGPRRAVDRIASRQVGGLRGDVLEPEPRAPEGPQPRPEGPEIDGTAREVRPEDAPRTAIEDQPGPFRGRAPEAQGQLEPPRRQITGRQPFRDFIPGPREEPPAAAAREADDEIPQGARATEELAATRSGADEDRALREPEAGAGSRPEPPEEPLQPRDRGDPALPPRQSRINQGARSQRDLEQSLDRADETRNRPRLSREQRAEAEIARDRTQKEFSRAAEGETAQARSQWERDAQAAREERAETLDGLSGKTAAKEGRGLGHDYRQGWRDAMDGDEPRRTGQYYEEGHRDAQRYVDENPRPEGPETVTVTSRTARGRETRFEVANDADRIEQVAENLNRLPIDRFYANPLDPKAFSDLYGPMFRDMFGWAKREFDTWADEVQSLAESLKGSSALTPIRAVADVGRKLWYSNDGLMRTLANRFKVDGKPNPVITEIADMFFARPGRRDSQGVARTYGEAVATHTQERLNELSKILMPFNKLRRAQMKDALEQIGRKIRSGQIRKGASDIDNAADAIRKLLREELDYLREAGVDIGDAGANYFPRELDVAKVIANARKFRQKAAELYRAEGASAKEAADLADAWFNRILESDLGFRSDGNDFIQINAGTTGTRFEKSRTFSKNREKILAEFDLTNPADVLPLYFIRSARRAEWVRRMGNKLERWKDLKQGLRDSGAAEAVKDIVDILQSATGTMAAPASHGTRTLLSFFRGLGSLAFLTRATLSSLSEPVMAGVRSGNAGDAINSYLITLRDLLGNAKRGARSGRDQMARDLAEDLGIIGRLGDDMLMQQRFGGQVDGKFARWLQNQFFLRTGLHHFTESTRVASVRTAQTFVRRLAKDIVNGGNRQKSARFLLGELGVAADEIDTFAKWVVGQNDGFPTSDILGGDKGNVAAYRTAMMRFANQTIMHPSAIEKPILASHPFYSLFYHLQSFLYSFQKNVINRMGNLTLEAMNPKADLNIADRLRLMAPLGVFPLAIMSQWGLTDLRDSILDDPARKPEDKERSAAEKLFLAVSRAGGLGILDLPLNILTGIRFQKDPATTMVGPIFGTLSELLGAGVDLAGDRNSPNTNTAERRFARLGYDIFVEPAIAAGFSMLPGRVGAAIAVPGIQAAATPAARENVFVEPLAGPPKFKQSGGGDGRQSGRSGGSRSSGRSSGR